MQLKMIYAPMEIFKSIQIGRIVLLHLLTFITTGIDKSHQKENNYRLI